MTSAELEATFDEQVHKISDLIDEQLRTVLKSHPSETIVCSQPQRLLPASTDMGYSHDSFSQADSAVLLT